MFLSCSRMTGLMLVWIVVDMLRTTFEIAIVGAMLVCPFLGLFYTWSQCHAIFQRAELPGWRRSAGILGLFSVTLQATLFIALWTPVSRYRPFMALAVPVEVLLFFLTLPSIFTRKGNARWWLLVSSLFLSVDSFFVVLTELTY